MHRLSPLPSNGAGALFRREVSFYTLPEGALSNRRSKGFTVRLSNKCLTASSMSLQFNRRLGFTVYVHRQGVTELAGRT